MYGQWETSTLKSAHKLVKEVGNESLRRGLHYFKIGVTRRESNWIRWGVQELRDAARRARTAANISRELVGRK